MAKKKDSKAIKVSSLTRKGVKFTVKWTKGETYTKQQLKWWLKYTDGSETTHQLIDNISNGTTSKQMEIDGSKHYPAKATAKPIAGFCVALRGIANKKNWSIWTIYTMFINPPKMPTLEVAHDTATYNKTTFSWSVTDEEKNPATNIAFQTLKIQDWSGQTNLEQWKTAAITGKPMKGTTDPDYVESDLAGKSWTRLVRVVARGLGGNSTPNVKYYTYADPNAAEITGGSGGKVNTGNNTTSGTVNVSQQTDPAHPVDNITLQYWCGVPAAGMTVPNNATPTDLQGAAGWNGSDQLAYNIPVVPALDEVLFSRTATTYNGRSSYSSYRVEKRAKLKPPAGLSVTLHGTNSATVSFTSLETQVPDAYTLVYYRDNVLKQYYPCGYIPHGSSSVQVYVPDFSERTYVQFGINNMTSSTGPINTGTSTDMRYEVFGIRQESEIVWQGGQVPQAPASPTVNKKGDTSVNLSWKWSWSTADSAEVSWSEEEDAWESTNPPSTYFLDYNKATDWTVSGLTAGKVYYFRIRLAKHNGDQVTYGPYSAAVSMNMAIAPEQPPITLDKYVIKDRESFTAYWTHRSSDGTEQAAAQVAEYSGKFLPATDAKNYTVLAEVKKGTHATISTPPKVGTVVIPWTTGSGHRICVRTLSESGEWSPWSAQVTLKIAKPIFCNITQTSLISGTDQTYDGREIHIVNSGNMSFRSVVLSWTPRQNGTPSAQEHVAVTGQYVPRLYLSPTSDQEDADLFLAQLTKSPIFGGSVDLQTGTLTQTWDYIYKYQGEELPGEWMSDRDVYAAGTTPTIGAFVAYELETPAQYHVKTDKVEPLDGDNYLTVEATSTCTIDLVVSGVPVLTALPLTVTATGAGTSGTTAISVTRVGDYTIKGPDEVELKGYDGETIYVNSFTGSHQDTIELEDLLGRFDDGSQYLLRATVTDQYGQTASQEIPFFVAWSHQATIPYGTVTIDETAGVAVIRPYRGAGSSQDDTINIYRLSADKPELIYEGAPPGQSYVDPYPTIGEHGGYRLATITTNGDFITAEDIPATVDIQAGLDSPTQLIDFDGRQLELMFNADLDNTFTKRFQSTRYLGGDTEGDWEAGVDMTGSVSAQLPEDSEPENYMDLRRLGRYDGICHVRTRDGGNFTANVDVQDGLVHNSPGHPHNVTLTITRVDNTELDGMTYTEWEAGE